MLKVAHGRSLGIARATDLLHDGVLRVRAPKGSVAMEAYLPLDTNVAAQSCIRRGVAAALPASNGRRVSFAATCGGACVSPVPR